MHLIENPDVFKKHMYLVESNLHIGRNFPEKIIRDCFSEITFVSSDEIFLEGFISRMKSFLESINESEFYLLMLDPEPEEYFFYHFQKYPLARISSKDTEDKYFSVIETDPGNRDRKSVV